MSLNTVRGVNNIGAADAVTKAYIRKNEVFADAFNYFMYDGVQVIQPECLKELDSTEIAILLNEKDTKDKKDIPNSKNNIDKTIPVIQPIPNFNKNIIASFLFTSVFFVDVKAFNELINLL